MLLKFRPKRVIEIGSGFSSRLLLDVNDDIFNGAIEVTLIDPNLDAAQLAAPKETQLLQCSVQDVNITKFDALEANDILFIDSSHVTKTGSDVNFYLFEVVPRLKAGVIIHIHDVLYPFEYPEPWILDDKRSWNEAYLIRAFLQYNSAFEIIYWNNFVYHKMMDALRQLMPLCIENEGGSIWLRRS
jgi:predicted O-methyltransferase YrrM